MYTKHLVNCIQKTIYTTYCIQYIGDMEMNRKKQYIDLNKKVMMNTGFVRIYVDKNYNLTWREITKKEYYETREHGLDNDNFFDGTEKD